MSSEIAIKPLHSSYLAVRCIVLLVIQQLFMAERNGCQNAAE